MPLAVIGAVVGEFVGSNNGLGNLILLATGSSNSTLTFAALFSVTALSLFLFFLIELLNKRIRLSRKFLDRFMQTLYTGL